MLKNHANLGAGRITRAGSDQRMTLKVVCSVALIVAAAGCGGSHNSTSLQGQARAGDHAYINLALRTLPPYVSGLFPGKPASRSQLLSFGPCCNHTRAMFHTEIRESAHAVTVRFVESWRAYGGLGSHTWKRVISAQSGGDKITERRDYGGIVPQLIP